MAKKNVNQSESVNMSDLMKQLAELQAKLAKYEAASVQPTSQVSEWTATPNELTWCEYSKSSYAFYGDLKDKKDRLDIIRGITYEVMGEKSKKEQKVRPRFVRNLLSIPEHPAGWTINKPAFDVWSFDSLISALESTGLKVTKAESVSAITEQRKSEKEVNKPKKVEKTEPKKVETAKTESKKAETAKKSTPIKSAEPAKKEKKADKPTPKETKLQGKTLCYEVNSKSENGYAITERKVQSRGNGVYVYAGTKRAVIYAHVGQDCETGDSILVQIAKVMPEVATQIIPADSEYAEICTMGVYEAVKAGKLKATAAHVYAYVDMGKEYQEQIKFIYAKMNEAA